MKRYLFIGVVAMMLLGMTSCKNEPQFHKSALYLTVAQNEWKYDDTNAQFYAHFNLPEITANVYNYGNYSLHRVYNFETANEYQVALPETVYLMEIYTDETTSETYEYYYQQQVNYRIGPGYVEIQVTNSDYMYAPGNPERMDFHLQLTW